MLQQTGRFAREHRLNSPAEYQQVFRAPCRSKDEIFLVIARKNGGHPARLGLAMPRKWVKLAVTRNKLKRLIRESFRKHQQLLSGLDIVVTTSRSQKQLNNKTINNSLQNHWQRLVTCKK